MKILMVVTSHEDLGDTGQKTGLWLEEFAAPYYYFKEQKCQITVASPKGGCPPLDPKSAEQEHQTESTKKFEKDLITQEVFKNTIKLSEINVEDFSGVYYPGGHGPLWDLVGDQNSIALIEKALQENKPVGSVCHGPAVLINVKDEAGHPIVRGKKVTSFSNEEEKAIGLEKVVPHLIETCFKEQGGLYSCAEPWVRHVESDDLLVTGQNPASSVGVAKRVIEIARALN
jgi:putative intracellular protease/amidase